MQIHSNYLSHLQPVGMCVYTHYLSEIRLEWLLFDELILEFYLAEKAILYIKMH